MILSQSFLHLLLQPVKRNLKCAILPCSTNFIAYRCNKSPLKGIHCPCRTLSIKKQRSYTIDKGGDIDLPSEQHGTLNSKQPEDFRQGGTKDLKSHLISELNYKCKEDSQPFTKLPVKTLLHIHKVTKNDHNKGYCQNRLYYISEKIQCPPSVLSCKLAQRIFVYSLSFEWLESSLKVLLEYGVPTNRILRDLWVLKYHHETIRERLQRVKDAGIDVLYPWMVRCSEDILQRFINLTIETKDILREVKSTQAYLANRLNISPENVEDMCQKIPALKTIRVTKVKSFLDFLQKEGFDVDNIASKPRVLTASQRTVEQRLEKLRKLGLRDINLNVLCRSRKDFKRYLESIQSAVENQ